ncbi:MAG: PfkB family carbohydrate kinase [Elusimicrobiota bacterium]
MGIVVVGSIALDTVSTPRHKKQKVLGGSAVYSAIAASHFVNTRLLGIIGEDYPEEALSMLECRGIDLEGVERSAGRTFAWEGEYGDDLREPRTLSVELNAFAGYSPKIPAAYALEEILFLGNIDPDLQSSVFQKMRSPRIVAADTMGHWLDLKLESLKNLLPSLNVFFINESEAKKLAGEGKVVRAAFKIGRQGPHLVVIKCGEYGALAWDSRRERFFWEPAYPTFEVIDPTGAGDSFAGGFLGSLSAESDPYCAEAIKRALAVGNVLASFAISSLGPDGVLGITREGLAGRLANLAAMSAGGACADEPAEVSF